MYTGEGFSVEYESDYDYSEFADIAFDDVGWAVGTKIPNYKFIPYLVKRDQATSEWTEITIDGLVGYALSRVIPINEDKCWLLVDDNYRSGEHDGVLAKYSAGSVQVYENVGHVTAVQTEGGRYAPKILYAVKYVEENYGPGENVEVYITADEGKTWLTETLPRDLVTGRNIVAAEAGGLYGPIFYLLVRFNDGAIGVVRRRGAPGNGCYEPIFFAYRGPYFTDLNGLSFRDAPSDPYGISVDGVAVGKDTTVVFDEGNVYLEKLPYASELSCVIRNLGTGFFAVGKSEPFESYELLYHP